MVVVRGRVRMRVMTRVSGISLVARRGVVGNSSCWCARHHIFTSQKWSTNIYSSSFV